MAPAPSSVDVKIEVAQLSDPGRDPNKQINEDSCGYAQTRFGHLCVLCDGMGGHYGGQEASRRAITTIFEQIEQVGLNCTPAQALKHAIEVAARRVYELGGPPDNKVRPGSTVVAMLLHDDGVDVAHVGDSRAYVIRSGQIYPLTRDHSMVQAMIDAGFITEEQAIGHPDANKITRALGMKPDVDVEVRPEPMELFAGDMLLTASDGLTDLALAKDILGATRQALASGGLDHACAQLVRMANERGGHDNITVQIARVTQTAQRRTRTGSTLNEAMTKTQDHSPMSAALVPNAAGSQPGEAPPGSGRTHDVSAHAADPGPTSVDRPRRERQETIPMTSAATSHDGTAVTAHAAGASAIGGLQLPPVPPLSSPANQTGPFQMDAGMAPMSTRYVGQQAVQHLPHATPGGLATPPPPLAGARPIQPTNAMTPMPTAVGSSPGFGPPPQSQHWASPPQSVHATPGFAGAAPQSQAYQGSPLAITQDSISRRGGAVDSTGRTGGNVLFLALAISFVVATVMLILFWVLFLRG